MTRADPGTSLSPGPTSAASGANLVTIASTSTAAMTTIARVAVRVSLFDAS